MPPVNRTVSRLAFDDGLPVIPIPGLLNSFKSTLPGPTTVEYATAAHEYMTNPNSRNALRTSLNDFMLPPSDSALFTSSFNPPLASYYDNTPHPSSSSSVSVHGKRQSFSPYAFPASSSSSSRISLRSSRQTSSTFDNPWGNPSQTAEAGPSLSAADSPEHMVVSPEPEAYDDHASPMAWSPPESLAFSEPLDPDQPLQGLYTGLDSAAATPQATTSALPRPTLPYNFELNALGPGSTGYIPLSLPLQSRVALDDDGASVFSVNPAGTSSDHSSTAGAIGGRSSRNAMGDLNKLLQTVFTGSGDVFTGTSFISTDRIKREKPNIAGIGKWSRLLRKVDSFRWPGWQLNTPSAPGAISDSTQETIDLFCTLQQEHTQQYKDKNWKILELCESCTTLCYSYALISICIQMISKRPRASSSPPKLFLYRPELQCKPHLGPFSSHLLREAGTTMLYLQARSLRTASSSRHRSWCPRSCRLLWKTLP